MAVYPAVHSIWPPYTFSGMACGMPGKHVSTNVTSPTTSCTKHVKKPWCAKGWQSIRWLLLRIGARRINWRTGFFFLGWGRSNLAKYAPRVMRLQTEKLTNTQQRGKPKYGRAYWAKHRNKGTRASRGVYLLYLGFRRNLSSLQKMRERMFARGRPGWYVRM